MTDTRTVAWLSLDSGDTVVVNKQRAKAATPTGRAPASEPAEPSGGHTIETEHDMPALEALLSAHEVKTAILFYDSQAVADSTTDEAPVHASWRDRELDRLLQNVRRRSGEHAMDEDLAFLALLEDEQLDEFIASAEGLLQRPSAFETTWDRFLIRQERRIVSAYGFEALVDPLEDPELPVEERAPRLTLADLSIRFERGAIGAPPPLAP